MTPLIVLVIVPMAAGCAIDAYYKARPKGSFGRALFAGVVEFGKSFVILSVLAVLALLVLFAVNHLWALIA